MLWRRRQSERVSLRKEGRKERRKEHSIYGKRGVYVSVKIIIKRFEYSIYLRMKLSVIIVQLYRHESRITCSMCSEKQGGA